MKIKILFTGISLMIFTMAVANATPSTQIWNPSTDVQTKGTTHLGIDNYFNDQTNSTAQKNTYDLGLTYGLFQNCEIGIDLNEATSAPLTFNAKYGIPEGNVTPAVAVGMMNFGTVTDKNDLNISYLLFAKTFGILGRLSIGGYMGNPNLLKDNAGKTENTGGIISWDKSLSKKVWASVDYASSENSYGSLSGGVSYAFAENVSIIFGAVIYNNGSPTQATTQLDINI